MKKLRECENNPRNNALAVDKVKASIERLGFMFPIVIDMNYEIVCGHTRKLACAALDIKKIPCIMVDDLTPEQINLFRFVDNKTSEYASWDYDRLAEELQLIDITVEANDLVVKSFDFDLEAVEFENVPAEISIATFNFMGDDYKKETKKRPQSAPEPEEEEIDESLIQGDEPEDDDVEEARGGSSDGSKAVVYGETKKSNTPVLHTFRCGNTRFIISEREEERLIEAYTKYMSEVYPQKSFIQYLLGGVEIVEVQSEGAD